MQTLASKGNFSRGRFQQPSRRSSVVVGFGAALVASALTVALMMQGPGGVAAPERTATASTQCQNIPRKLLVSTDVGSGTIRLRAGSYLSPPIALRNTPQEVVFPQPRPAAGFVEEVITIQGNASNVVISSGLTEFRKVLDVTGVAAFNVSWVPMKTC
jgi:hypothetical protein